MQILLVLLSINFITCYNKVIIYYVINWYGKVRGKFGVMRKPIDPMFDSCQELNSHLFSQTMKL